MLYMYIIIEVQLLATLLRRSPALMSCAFSRPKGCAQRPERLCISFHISRSPIVRGLPSRKHIIHITISIYILI